MSCSVGSSDTHYLFDDDKVIVELFFFQTLLHPILHINHKGLTLSQSWKLSLDRPEMGNASSMLTQYDIEEVQMHCNDLFSQQEIVSLYHRFCQLDRSSRGFISADEFLSVPEFAMNPLSQRLLKMVDGLNFKDFVAFLSAVSANASTEQKVALIFKVYDSDGNGKVSFNDLLEVLQDLSGPFMREEQRERVLSTVLKEAGYTKESYLMLDDFRKVFGSSGLRMDVEIPVD